MMRQIRGAVLRGLGQVPGYEEFPAPVAGPGEAVVTVTAAALKPFDVWWAAGVHPASPATFPQLTGADGVGTLADGRRVAFFGPVPPYGGMAEQALVRDGVWFDVPDDADDVAAAALLNPAGAAWKTLMVEGALTAGQTVLVLGATGTAGRIAAQLARLAGARVVVAGRNQRVLDDLLARGADAAVRLDRPRAAASIAAAGPYDLVVDYLWGEPAEAAFAALTSAELVASQGRRQLRYVLVGMSAGQQARLPAMALRATPVQLIGSGFAGQASLREAAAAYRRVLELVRAGDIAVDIEVVPLTDVATAWTRSGEGPRIVFVP